MPGYYPAFHFLVALVIIRTSIFLLWLCTWTILSIGPDFTTIIFHPYISLVAYIGDAFSNPATNIRLTITRISISVPVNRIIIPVINTQSIIPIIITIAVIVTTIIITGILSPVRILNRPGDIRRTPVVNRYHIPPLVIYIVVIVVIAASATIIIIIVVIIYIKMISTISVISVVAVKRTAV